MTLKIEGIASMLVCLMTAWQGSSALTRQVVDAKTVVHYNMWLNNSYVQEKSLVFVVLLAECFTEDALANELLFPGKWAAIVRKLWESWPR